MRLANLCPKSLKKRLASARRAPRKLVLGSSFVNLLSFVIVVQFDRETDVIGVRWNVMLSNLFFFFNVISRCLSSHYMKLDS